MLGIHLPVEIKQDWDGHGRKGGNGGEHGKKAAKGLGTRPPIHEIGECVRQYGPYCNSERVEVT